MVTETVVKKGYKKTEIGIIPNDWKLLSIEELCSKNGLVRGPFGGTLKKEYFVDFGIKVYEQKNAIYCNTEIGSYYIDKTKYSELKRFEVFAGDFIVSCSGTIGKIYQIPTNAEKGIINQALLKIKTNADLIYDQYFLHYFQWDLFQARIIDNTQGGAMKNLVGMPIFRTISIPVPTSIKEQSDIATVLSDTDALITSLETLIEKKRNIKKGAMQELLTGKRRLPGFSGTWETKKLGDFLSYEQPTTYLVKDTEYNNNNKTPVLTAGKTFILGYTDEEYGIFNSLPVIIFDDFTTANKYVNFPFKAKSSAMKMLKLKNSTVNLRFIYEMMQMIVFPLSDHKRYWISEYQYLEIKVPSQEEQSAIAEILSNMDSKIEKLEQELAKYRLVKQGMMQELLTGKIRLI